MKKIVKPINYDWYVKEFDEKDLEEINLELFRKVDIPNQPFEFSENQLKLSQFHQKYTYVYKLDNLDLKKDVDVYLRFEGVAIESEVYVNNQHAGQHLSGYTPQRILITPYLNKDRDNEIKVIVSGIERPNIPPFGAIVDYLGYVGIYREVYLEVVDTYEISHVFAYSENPLINDKLNIEVMTSKARGKLTITVGDIEKTVDVNETITLIELEVKDKVLWDLDHPHLYDIDVKYEVYDKVYDQKHVRFGFRDIKFKADGFYLNGELIKLSGLNRHQSYPYVGYAMPKGAQYEDVDILKDFLGVDIVRSSHYPCSTHFLDRADEKGLLVLEEIPGWQYIGDDLFKEISYISLKNMIIRDRNHPSVCMWGVRINESPDDQEFYLNTNKIAHHLDPIRPTGGIRNLAQSEFLEDVYTYNDFSHVGNNAGLLPKKDVTKKTHPYLVTEYNGHMFPTKSFDTEERRVEHALRHLRVIHDMRDPNNGIAGAIGWSLFDYHTHPSFGSGDLICYHGILDINRMPKYAAYSYRSQQDKEPMMEILSSMDIGDYPGGFLKQIIVFTNLDYIRVYKDGIYINTFYPNKKDYPHLKHPPIIITDFIGESLAKQEHMKKRDAEVVKAIFREIATKGNKISLKYKLQLVRLLKKYKLSMKQGIALYYKYMTGWGADAPLYLFEGFENNFIKLSKKITHDEEFNCLVESNRLVMYHRDTYDSLRFTIKLTNGSDNLYAYVRDILKIKIEGPIELIGPKERAFEAGQLAVWIKSIGVGKAKITFSVRDQKVIKEVESV